MAAAVERRTVWFLVPDSSGTAILVDAEGALPHSEIELLDGETTVAGAARVAASRWGLASPVIELLFDPDVDADADAEIVHALIELAPAPPGWRSGEGCHWTSITAAPVVMPRLAPRVEELLAERRGERAADPRRSAWSRPGWYERACEWIGATLRDVGWGAPESIVQIRHWGISAVMRAVAPGGTAWFKAVFPGFHSEPRITAFLDAAMPGFVPPVLGLDAEAGWVLLADVGATYVSADLDRSSVAIERLVDAQRRFLGRTDDLLAAGCPARPLRSIAAALAAALGNGDVVAELDVSPERAGALVEWVAEAAAEIDAIGIPDTLVHGDFHPGNVALVDHRAVILDWSDGAVTNPLIDVLTWVWWTRDDPARTEAVWDAFLAAWRGIVDADRLRARRDVFVGVGAAYHTVSYAGILAGLEPSSRPQHADGLTEFFGLLDAAVPR